MGKEIHPLTMIAFPSSSNELPLNPQILPTPMRGSYSQSDTPSFFADTQDIYGALPEGVNVESQWALVDAEEIMPGHGEEIDTEVLDTSEALAHSVLRILCRSNLMQSVCDKYGTSAGEFIPFMQRHLSRHVPTLRPLLQDSDVCTTSSEETEDTDSTATSEFSHISQF